MKQKHTRNMSAVVGIFPCRLCLKLNFFLLVAYFFALWFSVGLLRSLQTIFRVKAFTEPWSLWIPPLTLRPWLKLWESPETSTCCTDTFMKRWSHCLSLPGMSTFPLSPRYSLHFLPFRDTVSDTNHQELFFCLQRHGAGRWSRLLLCASGRQSFCWWEGVTEKNRKGIASCYHPVTEPFSIEFLHVVKYFFIP